MADLSSEHSAARSFTPADLAWQIAAGCDVPVADTPRRWLEAPARRAPPPEEDAAPAPLLAGSPLAPPPARTSDPAKPHPALACTTPDDLLALLGRFPAAQRQAPLLWDGALDSGIWVLIDRPDTDPAHRTTIDRMLASIQLDWTQAALVSRLPWPIPGEPTADQLTRFTPVVERLATLAPPRLVLALGQAAAELAGSEARLVSSRGRWFGWGSAQLLPSLHPRIMTSNGLKKQAFEHLKRFREAIG